MTAPGRASCELAIVGGGPAGLAAATLAAALGVETVLFDEQGAPGGQIYRNVEAVTAGAGSLPTLLGSAYRSGRDLVDRFRRSGAAYEAGAAVWQVTPNGKLGISQAGEAYLVKASRIILANGAMERPVAIPGWTLPGVMGAGAAQTLLKGSGLVPDQPTVIAGSGPLIFLVAHQLMEAGAPLKLILETSSGSLARALPRLLPALLGSAADLAKGLSWIAALRRKGIPILKASAFAAEGADRLQAVSFEAGGRRQRIGASLLLLHEGVIPNIQITSSIRCAHEWNEAQSAWRPVADEWGATSQEAVAVAGDGAKIRGAEAAVHHGRMAALDAAFRLGRISGPRRDDLARPERSALRRHDRFRRFLDAFYPPGEADRRLADETIACRCEEISAGRLRHMIDDGLTDINQIKAFSRCGMGQCQGRMCGVTIARVLAEHTGKSVPSVGYYRLRLPVKPLPISQLARLGNAETDPKPSLPVQQAGDPGQRV